MAAWNLRSCLPAKLSETGGQGRCSCVGVEVSRGKGVMSTRSLAEIQSKEKCRHNQDKALRSRVVYPHETRLIQEA